MKKSKWPPYTKEEWIAESKRTRDMAIAIDRAHPGIHDFDGDFDTKTNPQPKPKKLKAFSE